MTRIRSLAVLVALAGLALLAFARPAAAGMHLDRWKGHIAIGYARVFSDSLAPGGSLSASGGVEYPLSDQWRLGPSLSFDLLGSSPVRRGSVGAALDYSLFEVAMLATYLPSAGPVTRISVGPGLASPRADLSVAGGGALFRDLPVSEVKPEFAVDATLSPRQLKIVSVGLELGARVIPVTQGTWTLLSARFAIHF